MCDTEEYPFMLYDTIGLPESRLNALVLALNDGDEERDLFKIATGEDFRGKNSQAIVRYHRETEMPRKRAYSTMFIIVDRDPPDKKGVLMVHLEPDHGFADAVRQAPEFAGNSLASISVANTYWHENREGSEPEQRAGGMVPEDRFALYNMLPSAQNDSFELALKWMNDGVGELGKDDEFSSNPPPELPIGLAREYYRGISAEGKGGSLDELVKYHVAHAESQGLDPAMFAVFDTPALETEGILIVRAQPEFSSFRRTIPVAGEMLNWIFIGFMTWDEAKNWPDTASAAASGSQSLSDNLSARL